MPFSFDHAASCPKCPYGVCIEDRRANPVPGRTTKFRMRQNTALACTFSDFVPGSDDDPEPGRPFSDYLTGIQQNSLAAGRALFGSAFAVEGPAAAKVGGDIFEILEAAALWNAGAVWNRFMDSGTWVSTTFRQPAGSVPTPARKVAVLKLRRGYDPTRLFKPEVRRLVQAHEASLKLRGMDLGLSSPDMVGVRIPEPIPDAYLPFMSPLANLGDANRRLLEDIHSRIEGTLDGRSFLFAIAIKTSTRSDRLYQPLFEANVLKYLIVEVLRGAAFRFNVHMGTFQGADVVGAYKAASLVSLMRGGEPALAIDKLYLALNPTDTGQEMLDTLPLFPL